MIETNTIKQRQSWQGRAAPGPAVGLPLGLYQVDQSSSGLWSFQAEGVAYTIKRRQAVSTKPVLYLMAEVRPKPAYVSSLYFMSSANSKDGWGLDTELTAWTYTAQAAGADSPLRFVTFYLERQSAAVSGEAAASALGPSVRVSIQNSRLAADADLAQAFGYATDLWQVVSEGPFFDLS